MYVVIYNVRHRPHPAVMYTTTHVRVYRSRSIGMTDADNNRSNISVVIPCGSRSCDGDDCAMNAVKVCVRSNVVIQGLHGPWWSVRRS